MPNAETWLDFTDLVFVDPVGTGYSRFIAGGDEVRKQFWSVDGDIDVLATFMRKWIEKNGRQASKKFIAGESYGGFRAPKLAGKLDEHGVAVSGLVMVSPVIDFGWRGNGRHSPLAWVSRLPSMAATAREANAPFDREALREAERYAAGEYLQDLMRGERDSAAVERMTRARRATDRARSRDGAPARRPRRHPHLHARAQPRARTDRQHVRRDRDRDRPRPECVVLAPRGPGARRHARAAVERDDRPLRARAELARRGALSAAQRPRQLALGLGRRALDPRDRRRAARVLANDPRMRVLVAHGASDLVTPYFENQLILDQLPPFASPERLKLSVYGGGHMFYSRDASRRAFREDARALYRAVEEAAVPAPRG